MTETAANQLRRILHLIPLVADGEPHAVEELAGRAGVDRATLFRDIHSISERYEAPGGFVAGLQIYLDPEGNISVLPNHFARPMRLTRGELLALELGLAMLRAERPAAEHDAIRRAGERLRSVLAVLPDEPVGNDYRIASLSAAGSLEYLRTLRDAFRDRRKAKLGYQKAGDAAPTERVICPYGIVFARGNWYVVAHCEDTGDVRIFRLDRVRGVKLLQEKYEPRADFSLDAIVREGRAFVASDPGTLRVRYSPRIARWIAEREGKKPEPDGSLVVDHPLADLDWAVRHVLQYGTDAEVIEPVEVREEIVRRLEN